MAPIDIIVLILALGLAGYTLYGVFFRKKKEGACGCAGCNGCSAANQTNGGCSCAAPASNAEE